MELNWKVSPEDVSKVQSFVNQHSDDHFVEYRRKTNLSFSKSIPDRNMLWQRLLSCLLTSQQRSGPDSAISRFQRIVPFPLSYEICLNANDLSKIVSETLADFGGIRRTNRIGKEAEINLQYLENGGWEEIENTLQLVLDDSTAKTERVAANLLADRLKGFGSKQSRNFLQAIGFSKYEIPIDSRIINWLNKLPFPLVLSPKGLQDRNYYEFVSEGIQCLCEASDVLPCILDACIFAAVDKGKWKPEHFNS